MNLAGLASVVAAKDIGGLSFHFRRIDRRLHGRDIALRTSQSLKKLQVSWLTSNKFVI